MRPRRRHPKSNGTGITNPEGDTLDLEADRRRRAEAGKAVSRQRRQADPPRVSRCNLHAGPARRRQRPRSTDHRPGHHDRSLVGPEPRRTGASSDRSLVGPEPRRTGASSDRSRSRPRRLHPAR